MSRLNFWGDARIFEREFNENSAEFLYALH